MAYDYGKVFALRDNPFSPYEPFEGLTRINLHRDLPNNPLLINLEPTLECMYSSEAGPFGTFLENFKNFARQHNYRDKPPRVGNSSFIFSIYGFEGTGKTTLAQVIINWLKKCKPRTGEWHVHDEWSLSKLPDPAKQIERIDALEQKIRVEISKNSYCCVVVDNLVPGALNRALEMYDQLRLDWIVFLFLLSNESELFAELSGAGKRPLSAD
jgi:hypothetical protein